MRNVVQVGSKKSKLQIVSTGQEISVPIDKYILEEILVLAKLAEGNEIGGFLEVEYSEPGASSVIVCQHLVKQEVSVGGVNFDPVGISKLMDEVGPDRFKYFRGFWHSHGTMGVFHSITDLDSISSCVAIKEGQELISIVVNDSGSISGEFFLQVRGMVLRFDAQIAPVSPKETYSKHYKRWEEIDVLVEDLAEEVAKLEDGFERKAAKLRRPVEKELRKLVGEFVTVRPAYVYPQYPQYGVPVGGVKPSVSEIEPSLHKQEICSVCLGTGTVHFGDLPQDCETCGGTGWIGKEVKECRRRNSSDASSGFLILKILERLMWLL